MITPLNIIFVIACWVAYYFMNRAFNVNKKINSYIEKTKANGSYNENKVEIYIKYLNLKCISSTVMFIVVTISIFILEFTKINNDLIELIIVVAIGKIVLVIGDKIIDKKMPFEEGI